MKKLIAVAEVVVHYRLAYSSKPNYEEAYASLVRSKGLSHIKSPKHMPTLDDFIEFVEHFRKIPEGVRNKAVENERTRKRKEAQHPLRRRRL